eukprot:TRINITY_DN67179_c10_g4_i1.p1 TRINITY_DN67179_c10_g4~~TRINITY_DN67179_c10_g4_i1.p1  ORF type:complete len:903 (+),score=586.26 TRINITY_DN67179_c10_g4_i1:107-2815(+)
MSVVGIDIGDQSSVIAVARRRGIDALQNEVGNRKTPTMVGYSDQTRAIGESAVAQFSGNYKNTIMYFKRLVGRRADEPDVKVEQEYVQYPIVADARGNAAVQVMYNGEKQTMTAEQVMAAMLTQLKATAHRSSEGMRVVDCVLACPTYFTDAQRRSMIDAARVAGLNVLRLMNESTAVALNYGILRPLPEKEERTVLFYDMGHTATTAAVVSFVSGRLKVLATASDRHLGGRNFDRLVMDYFAADIKKRYNLDVYSQAKATLKLAKECHRVKKILSANQVVPFNVEFIMNDTDVSGKITREEYEQLAADAGILNRVTAVVDRALTRAGITSDKVHSVEIVGGGTRVPCVQKALEQRFGRPLSKTCDGDESVARGCALMCAMLSPAFQVKKFEVQDVTPYAMTVSWGAAEPDDAPDDDQHLVFQRNNPIPNTKMITFRDRTKPFRVSIKYANPEELPSGTSEMIGQYVISGLPPDFTEDDKGTLKVYVKVDLNGVVRVSSASLVRTVEVKPVPQKDATANGDAEDDGVKPMEAETTPAAAEDGSGDANNDKNSNNDANDDSNKMDTTADDSTPKAAEVQEPKTKSVKTRLQVQTRMNYNIPQPVFDELFAKETSMAHQDQVVAETQERRNELEDYILQMRDRIFMDDDLGKFVTEESRNAFSTALDDAENWMWEDGMEAQRSDVVNKLQDLRRLGNPIEQRKYEAAHRDEYVGSLQQTMQNYRTWLNQARAGGAGAEKPAPQDEDEAEWGKPERKYSHLSAADLATVSGALDAAEAWLSQQMAAQAALPASADAVLTCEQLRTKNNELAATCSSVSLRPKPKAKKPKKKQAENDSSANDNEHASKKQKKAGSSDADGAAASAASSSNDADNDDSGAAEMDTSPEEDAVDADAAKMDTSPEELD